MPLMGKQPKIANCLKAYAKTLPYRPKTVLLVTAHWETDVPTVSTATRPPLLFDYGGFPPETYRYEYPAPGSPDVAKRVRELLSQAGIKSGIDGKRGWDHGTFVPMMLMFE